MSEAGFHGRPHHSVLLAGDGATVGDFVALLKPRVMTLVVFTAIVGLVHAPGTLHPVLAAVAILAIGLGAGASGALNMWYDADIDGVMGRTVARPIPSGAVAPETALAFGIVLSLVAVITLGLATNWLAGGLLAFTIVFYVVIYTMWLKRWTPQNIVIGGAAGAFPPMIGWAAVTGGLSWESAALFLIIFLWTPPHFWALALVKKTDYERARVPMLPNVHGDRVTRRQILAYSVVLVPAGMLPAFMGFASMTYGVLAFVAGLVMLHAAWRVWREGDGKGAARACWRLFGLSILYLFAVFAALLVERLAFLIAARWLA